VKRELFAAAAIPILVVTIGWMPAWGFLAILGVAALLACDEYLKLARAADIVVGRWLVLTLMSALLVVSWLRGISDGYVLFDNPMSKSATTLKDYFLRAAQQASASQPETGRGRHRGASG